MLREEVQEIIIEVRHQHQVPELSSGVAIRGVIINIMGA